MTDTIHNEPPVATIPEEQPQREYGVMFSLIVPGLMFYLTGEWLVSGLLQTVLSRALQYKGILLPEQPGIVIGRNFQIIGVFFVTDKWTALQVIRGELDRLKVFQFAQLGYLDSDERGWQGWYPPDLAGEMQKNWEKIQKWQKIADVESE